MQMLRTQLLSQQLMARSEFETKERKQQRGTGDRSEKIRTYNFQRGELIDHVLGKVDGTHFGASNVLYDEQLDDILQAYRERARESDVENTLRFIEDKLKVSS